CDEMRDPAPMAMTSNSWFKLLLAAARGDKSPQAVVIATVAEPGATPMRAATNQPSSNREKVLIVANPATPPPTPPVPSTPAEAAARADDQQDPGQWSQALLGMPGKIEASESAPVTERPE